MKTQNIGAWIGGLIGLAITVFIIAYAFQRGTARGKTMTMQQMDGNNNYQQ